MGRRFSRLTRINIRRLKAGESITEYGISVERKPTGDARWTINAMINGVRVHRLVGWESDGTTLTTAEEYLAKVRHEAKNDRLNLPRGRKIALSFREAANRYLGRLEAGGGKNIKIKRRQLIQHILPFFGDMPFGKVTSFHIEKYKKMRRTEVAIPGGNLRSTKDPSKLKLTSEKTINRELATIGHIYSMATEWGWLAAKPCVIRKFKEGRGRRGALSPAQMESIIKSAEKDQSLHIHPFVMIGFNTAMRKMEILSMRKSDIDFERLTIHVPIAKSGAREQPISPRLGDFLKAYIAALPINTDWLFPSPRAKNGHAVEIREPFCRVVREAGLDPTVVVRHTMRHSVISGLVKAGVDIPTIMKISGHKTMSMVLQYTEIDNDHIQAALSKYEDRYRSAAR